jgi:putative DNA primase/helicase
MTESGADDPEGAGSYGELGFSEAEPEPETKPETAANGGGGGTLEDWPYPADLLDSKPMPAFPIDFLPDVLGRFVADTAERMQAPADYGGVAAIIAAATVIGKDFLVAPKTHDTTWKERACLWCAVIGDIGQKKSPSFAAALAPVYHLQASFREDDEAAQKAYRVKQELAKQVKKAWGKECQTALRKGEEPPPLPEAADPGECPAHRQLLTTDITQERIVGLMDDNPRGIMLFRDELSGWLASFNQYRRGSDEEFYLQCHAGGPWTQDRKSGDVFLPDVYLSILGGFQPAIIAETLSRHSENGLAARFSMLVWPDTAPPKWVDRPGDAGLREKVLQLFTGLRNLDPEKVMGPRRGDDFPPLHFTASAQEVFRTWYVDHHRHLAALESEDPLKGHFAKYDGLFARLALVRHLIAYTLNKNRLQSSGISEETAQAVEKFIEDYLRPHAYKVHYRLSRGTVHHRAQKIGRMLLDHPKITSFTARDISQKDWSGFARVSEKSPDPVLTAITYLENVAGWIRSKEHPTTGRGGRPTVSYEVNPLIHTSLNRYE